MQFSLNTIANLLKSDLPVVKVSLFLFKTLLFYLLLNYFFTAFTGLTIPGGRLDFPFIREHLDFISAFRRFLLWGGAQFASLIGYPSGYTDFTMYVQGGAAVRMVYSCMGFSLISAYAALVLAWPARWTYKAMSLSAGTVIIILLNMIRLGGLAVLYTTGHYGFFEYVNHHDLFNIVVLIVAFIMFVIYIKYAEGRETPYI